VVPSISFKAGVELKSVKGVFHYEERLLYVLLALNDPKTSLIYTSAAPIDHFVVDYYLGLIGTSYSAVAKRLKFYSLNNDDLKPLTEKINEHPRLINRIRREVHQKPDSVLMVYRGTDAESNLSKSLGIPMYSASESQQFWGTKAGSRIIFKECNIPHPDGSYSACYDRKTLAKAIIDTMDRNRNSTKGVVKLLEGYA
jgi:hypothetical protein